MSRGLVNVLMERDGMSLKEAQALIEETREEIFLSIEEGCMDDVEDIMASNLGLELDYIFDLL